MKRAIYQYMMDDQGRTYLDAYNNIPHVGHCHPKVVDAISQQAACLNTNTRYVYNNLADYAERLLSLFHDDLNRCFLVNSGSEASDLAIRIARTTTGRSGLMVMEHGYHGQTQTGIWMSHYKFSGHGGPGANRDVTVLSLPNLYSGTYDSAHDYIIETVKIIDQLVAEGRPPAALIVEPISGCGGQVPIASGFLIVLAPILKRHGILLIMDEVQTGFGRLGSHFWGHQLHDVLPDLVVIGKPMANGHPMGGLVLRQDIAEAFDNGMEFFSSFGGNPVSCEAARAVLDVIEEEGLQQNAQVVGDYFISELSKLGQDFACIGDVRGSGLFIGVEMIHPLSATPATGIASTIKNELRNQFVLTSTDGPYDNVIKMKPPLCFNRTNVDEVVDKMRAIMGRLDLG